MKLGAKMIREILISFVDEYNQDIRIIKENDHYVVQKQDPNMAWVWIDHQKVEELYLYIGEKVHVGIR